MPDASPQLSPARPSAGQLAWQDQEIGMFFHYDMQTFVPDWEWRTWRDLPDPARYNPAKLDTDQWLAAAQALGAKYAVFVAKHCSGFLQWQSDLYPYGVRQAPWRGGQGDVVADFVASCRRCGIQPGLYASVTANAYWQVDNPGLVNRGAGGDSARQAEYKRVCEGMLTELWTRYGELGEVWFDGGALPPEEGGPDLLPLLERYQPQAMVFQGPAATIRWVGNEDGVAADPCWATVPSLEAAHADREVMAHGDPEGRVWLPGECDVPLRGTEWFWTPDGERLLRPLEELVTIYYQSVGRNCNLLLNATPDPEGLIPAADFARYEELGREIRRRFERPLAETSGEGELLELALPATQLVDSVSLREDIAQGERVREWVVEGQTAEGWQPLCAGSCVGHGRLERFEAVAVSGLRWRCTKAAGRPKVRSFAAYGG